MIIRPPPAGYVPVYTGVGQNVWTTVFDLANNVDPALDFDVVLAPTLERMHIGYPASLGRARFTANGFDQTGAFSGPLTIEIAGVQCYVYSTNKRVTSASVTISVGA
jgi:hypothetical protein